MSGVRSILIALALTCFLAVPAVAEDEGTPERGGTAVFVLTQDPTTINPVVSSNTPDRIVGCTIYEGLVQVGVDYKIVPVLAKSWTISEDGLTYHFDLVHTNWQDGTPFTSEDVKYSILEINTKYSSVFAAAGKLIDAIDTPAPDQVTIHMKRPFGPLLLSLACNQGGAILPAHLYRGTNPLQNPTTLAKPVDTGPFKLVEWQRGDHIRMVRYDGFHEPGKPYLDEVAAKIIPQSPLRIQALQAGEVDVVHAFPPNERAAVMANPKLKVERSDIVGSFSILFLNLDRKPLGDKRVRQALMMGTDRDYLMKTTFFDQGTVGVFPFTTDLAWIVDPAIDYRKMYPFDIARANALLDEAGVKRGADGKRFTLTFSVFGSQYPELQQAAVAIKGMWQALGVDVTVQPLEDATLLQRAYVQRDFDATLATYATYSDPALGVARAFATASIGKAFGNPSGYSNPVVDDLFEKGERATSIEERGPFYRQAAEILAEDMPVLTLRQFRNIDAASKRLHGLWGKVQTNANWVDAWLSK